MQAIYFEGDLPADKAQWREINQERAAALPVITRPSAPLPTADEKRARLGFSPH